MNGPDLFHEPIRVLEAIACLALVPEAIAFSFVAKVDPLVGVYAAVIVCLIMSLFGADRG